MKDIKVIIDSNKQVGADIFLMRLKGDLKEIKNPGEFIEITIPNNFVKKIIFRYIVITPKINPNTNIKGIKCLIFIEPGII